MTDRPSTLRPESVLEIRRLRVDAGDRCILSRVRLRLEPGEVIAVTGPSGVGKSTLLRSVNRLLELRPGLKVHAEVSLGSLEIYAADTNPDVVRRRVGFLFQRPVVFPGSLRANLTLPLRTSGIPKRLWQERLENCLDRAALWPEVADRLDDDATRLSLGQQQRLCLARALVVRPEVLLLDEPTSALDAVSTATLEEGLAELSADVSMLFVTHDEDQAERLASRRLELVPGTNGAVLEDSRMTAPDPPSLHQAVTIPLET